VQQKNARRIIGLVVVFAVTVALGLLLFLRYLDSQARIRILRSSTGSGVLMAVNAEGLRELNELYSLPKTCSPDNFYSADILTKIQLCNPIPRSITSAMVKNGLVLIPEGTRAIYMGRHFILPGGRLVFPYASDTFDMARDGAVEVERVRITQPPNTNLEGWVETHFLGRVCCGL
jgi:hypothetical protein